MKISLSAEKLCTRHRLTVVLTNLYKSRPEMNRFISGRA